MYLSIIQGVKYLLLIGIFGLSTAIGFLISKSYQNRVVELKEFKTILNIMKTKIKFTYEPLAEIFKQIAKDNDTEIEKIFGQMANQLSYYQVKEVWENCIQDADISIKQEDKDVLKKLQRYARNYLRNYLHSTQYGKGRKLQAIMACHIPAVYTFFKNRVTKDGE